ncbi:MAG: geranylgeranylglyceryl/heptaprenylglyceryl phosphate synthase [Bacteroidales bacterium]|nr:geranylgeranylglyceryl/heptaprenylglyceryl phosphate synthase [Bacteroidales bacterium]
MKSVYSIIENGKRNIALLLDPDKEDRVDVPSILNQAQKGGIDIVFVGGSLVRNHVPDFIDKVKRETSLPVVLFPGSSTQFAPNADAILLLSLLSGRNADFLIGNHVQVAFRLKNSGVEIIPTGYILIDGGAQTSVQYMSNTSPIPRDKTEIIVATALAGEQLGLKLIYLEAGSGAANPVPIDVVKAVRQEISLPIVVGGGIKTPQQISDYFDAGANLVVLGNSIENNPDLLLQLR